MAEPEGDLYCLCRRPYDPSEFMIECDVCKDWFHGSCVGIEENQADDIDTYHCPNCQPEHGPLTLKRRRNWHRHDYSEINDGNKAIQSGTVAFISKLKQKKFLPGEEVMELLSGSELTEEHLEGRGFSRPIMVRERKGLEMRLPPQNFSISDVERCVGSMRELDVIDVARQDDIKMKMREWTEYYENQRPRKKVLNVISLEFTDTGLDKLVVAPSVVRNIDWIERHWPEKLPAECELTRPQVQKYCLMGIKDSYTDFHVDFGGTSVWYHVLRGRKEFYLIPPTDSNLINYEQWVMSSRQSEVFFGDLVPHCYTCTVLPGNTLFIPTGWIHSVLTPEDSLVFGGNFIHRFNIALQLRIYEMEIRLETPWKFRHPSYEALTWFAARGLLTELKGYQSSGSTAPAYLLEGLKEMIFFLKSWTRSRETMKVHQCQIPSDINHQDLTDQLSKKIIQLECRLQPVIGAAGQQDGLKFIVRKQSSSDEIGSDDIPPCSSLSADAGTTRAPLADAASPLGKPVRKWALKDCDSEDTEDNHDSEDEDYVYPSLVGDSETLSNRRSSRDDDLWKPQGPVKLIKDSIASAPRERRHAKKRSFEHCLSATASKILKMEQDAKLTKPKVSSVPKPHSIEPLASGGSLSMTHSSEQTPAGSEEGGGGGRASRATAAATAVHAVLVASKPKNKLLTPKQRLGKILGLSKAGSRWKN